MKFQIKEGDFRQGVKRLQDGQMKPRASSTLISGICPGLKYITIMSLASCLQPLSEL